MPLIILRRLDEQQVREFQFLYHQHYGIKLTQEEAHEKEVKFLRFMTVVFDNYDEFFDDEEKPTSN
ncbi:hypothetical protein C1H87_10645 [Flavivirga eckloniae]|uniref:Uncharacterized protein n=1 Tax=Flavivirga eckloniae TaxID=1803846 RepID=A0A2K9PPY2_9FLAO|nr:hypothetical protein C1H87_10645 [Flavivirga eckloniae]